MEIRELEHRIVSNRIRFSLSIPKIENCVFLLVCWYSLLSLYSLLMGMSVP